MALRFGEFVVDWGARQLRRGSEVVPLTPKEFELLRLLIDERPRVVAKRELMDRLWPDAIVEEANIRNLAAEVRGALHDDDRAPRYIRTVHRVGYAFIADAIEDANLDQQTRAALIGNDRVFVLMSGRTVIGKGSGCALPLLGHGVSRQHAAITITADGAAIEDLASKNGTFVNGHRIASLTELHDGDLIHLGATELRFSAIDAPTSSIAT